MQNEGQGTASQRRGEQKMDESIQEAGLVAVRGRSLRAAYGDESKVQEYERELYRAGEKASGSAGGSGAGGWVGKAFSLDRPLRNVYCQLEQGTIAYHLGNRGYEKCRGGGSEYFHATFTSMGGYLKRSNLMTVCIETRDPTKRCTFVMYRAVPPTLKPYPSHMYPHPSIDKLTGQIVEKGTGTFPDSSPQHLTHPSCSQQSNLPFPQNLHSTPWTPDDLDI
eukprot:753492-Hanusia_phi.AAC.6